MDYLGFDHIVSSDSFIPGIKKRFKWTNKDEIRNMRSISFV